MRSICTLFRKWFSIRASSIHGFLSIMISVAQKSETEAEIVEGKKERLTTNADANISNRQGSHKFNFRNENSKALTSRCTNTGTTHHLSSRFISFFSFLVFYFFPFGSVLLCIPFRFSISSLGLAISLIKIYLDDDSAGEGR